MFNQIFQTPYILLTRILCSSKSRSTLKQYDVKSPWLNLQLLFSTFCCIYGREEKLLFTASNKLKELNLDTGVVKELINTGTQVYSIAYDVEKRYVYLPILDGNLIYRFPYPNDQTGNLEAVVYATQPYYVAFDLRNSHLYWTESTTFGRIMRCNSDGSNVTTILTVTDPIPLALDMQNRWIYYSNYAGQALNRVTFEGKENQVVTNLTSSLISIRVDFVYKRVFFMEYDTGDLKSALYNGSDVKTVISTNEISNNREIDIGSDYLFYTSNNKILKIHKSSGQIPTTVHTDTAQIYGLLFYKQDGEQRIPRNVVRNSLMTCTSRTCRRQGRNEHLKNTLKKDKRLLTTN